MAALEDSDFQGLVSPEEGTPSSNDSPEIATDNSEVAGALPAVPPIIATLAAIAAIVTGVAGVLWTASQVHDRYFADKSIYRDLPSDVKSDVFAYEDIISEGLDDLRSDVQVFDNMSNLDAVNKIKLGSSIIKQAENLAKSYDVLADKLEAGIKDPKAARSETLPEVKNTITELREIADGLRVNPFSAQIDNAPSQETAQASLDTYSGTAVAIADKLQEGTPLDQLYADLSEGSSYFQSLPDADRDQLVLDVGTALANQENVLEEDSSKEADLSLA